MHQLFSRKYTYGIFIPFLAMVFVGVLALVALVIEAGNLYYTRSMFQGAVDLASLRGTSILKEENDRDQALCTEEERRDGESGWINCVIRETKEFLEEQLKLNKVKDSIAHEVVTAATVNIDTVTQTITISGSYPYQVTIFKAIESSWGQINVPVTGATRYKDTLVSVLIDATGGMSQTLLFPPIDTGYTPPSPTASPVPTIWQPPAPRLMKKFEAAELVGTQAVELLGAGDVFSAQAYGLAQTSLSNITVSAQNRYDDKVRITGKLREILQGACNYLSDESGHSNFLSCPGPTDDGFDYEAALLSSVALMEEGHEEELERYRKVIIMVVGNPASHYTADYGGECIADDGTVPNQTKIRYLKAIRAADSIRLDHGTFIYILGLGSSECGPPAINDPYQINVMPSCAPGSNRIKNVLLRRLAFDRSGMTLGGDPTFDCGSISPTFEVYEGMYTPPYGGGYPVGFEFWTVYRFLLRSMRGYRGVLER